MNPKASTVRSKKMIRPRFAFSEAAAVPALFLFGDTLVDVGNNNKLLTRFKANYPPYGFNFPHKQATGRFCDGRLIPDFLASYLGLPYPPPYASNKSFTYGANFGSAGSGIVNWAGNRALFSLQDQVDHFYDVQKRLKLNSSVNEFMKNSLFFICTGNQDVSNMVNLRGPLFAAITSQLLTEMNRQMQRLYALGARKFVVVGVNAFACSPSKQRFGLCNLQAMYAAINFNVGLARMLIGLRFAMVNSQIVNANLGNLLYDVKANPRAHGFTNSIQGCCPLLERSRVCYLDAEFCPAPSEYMFWDMNYPTEAMNRIVAREWWNGTTRYIVPFNISTLVGSVALPEDPPEARVYPRPNPPLAPPPSSKRTPSPRAPPPHSARSKKKSKRSPRTPPEPYSAPGAAFMDGTAERAPLNAPTPGADTLESPAPSASVPSPSSGTDDPEDVGFAPSSSDDYAPRVPENDVFAPSTDDHVPEIHVPEDEYPLPGSRPAPWEPGSQEAPITSSVEVPEARPNGVRRPWFQTRH